MTTRDHDTKLDEVDRLLNDPEVLLDPRRIWALLDDIARAADGSERCRRADRYSARRVDCQVTIYHLPPRSA